MWKRRRAILHRLVVALVMFRWFARLGWLQCVAFPKEGLDSNLIKFSSAQFKKQKGGTIYVL